MSIDRIKKNLKLDTNDVVEQCKRKILNSNYSIDKQGRNWHCEIDNIMISINLYNYYSPYDALNSNVLVSSIFQNWLFL